MSREEFNYWVYNRYNTLLHTYKGPLGDGPIKPNTEFPEQFDAFYKALTKQIMWEFSITYSELVDIIYEMDCNLLDNAKNSAYTKYKRQ